MRSGRICHPDEKKEIARMRSGTIIAVLAALAILIFGVMWYSSDRGDVAVRQEADEVIQEEAAAPDGEPEAIEDTTEAAATSGEEDDGPIVVGDEITEDTIVVESATDDPVILDPDQSSASVEVVEDGEAGIDQGESVVAADAVAEDDPVAGDPNSESDPVVADDTSAADEPLIADDATGEEAPGTDESATVVGGAQETGSTASDLEELLIPANFDADEIVALIEGSDALSTEQRSSLQALVNGARNNPAMVEGAVESIRAALDLPPLE
jgi:hypothetical protein